MGNITTMRPRQLDPLAVALPSLFGSANLMACCVCLAPWLLSPSNDVMSLLACVPAGEPNQDHPACSARPLLPPKLVPVPVVVTMPARSPVAACTRPCTRTALAHRHSRNVLGYVFYSSAGLSTLDKQAMAVLE